MRRRTRTMYMHTIDGKPASYSRMHGGHFLWLASRGHRTRSATLAWSLTQIRREQAACIRTEWREWREFGAQLGRAEPNAKRYGYVLVEVPLE